MAKITMSEANVKEILPEGSIVTVKCLDADVEDVPSKKGGTWQKLNFKFEILEGPEGYDVRGDWIWGGVPFRFEDDPNNPLKMWAEALLGFDLNDKVGYELDTEDLIGKTCRGTIRNYERRNGGTGQAIDGLLPGKGNTSAPATSESPSLSDDGDDDLPF